MTDDFTPETEEVQPEPTPEPEPQFIEVAGKKLRPNELDPYVRFMDWAKNNPTGFDDLEAWERGEKVMVAPEQLQAPAVSPDLEDDFLPPALKQKISDMETFQRAWYEEREAEKKAAINAGVSGFQKDHEDLTPDELEAVMRTARDYELMRIHISRKPHDKTGAVKDALKAALTLTFPNREKEKAADQVVSDLAAKRKAAAATGASVSAPRVEPEPDDPQKALIEDFRQALNEAR